MRRGEVTMPEAKVLVKLPESQRAEALQMKVEGRVKTVKGAVLRLKKAAVEAQAQAEPSKPRITFANCEDWLPLALSKVRSTGRAYVCIGAYPQELRAYLNVQACLPVQQILVWSYRNTMGPSPTYGYKQNWQAILSFCGPDAPPLDCPLLTEQFSAQEINAPDGRQGSRYHAWQKPDELAERLIRHATRPGDVLYDPFCGTGTFVLAGHRLGRIALGCDSSEAMLLLAEKRGCAIAR
jgi:hypothetical protein